MAEQDQIAEWFEASHGRLRAIAYRMLGSLSDVEDALQETWVRASQASVETIDNPASWLATIIARICLNMLRTRHSHRELPISHIPDPIISRGDVADPEQEALVAESVGLALMVVLQTLAPVERLAFVLHDVFDLSFEEVSSIIGKSQAATRQVASRARRRVQDAPTPTGAALVRQRQEVDAFFSPARGGDLETLVTLLDPEVILRADFGRTPASRVIQGASDVIRHLFTPPDAVLVPALINGLPGTVIFRYGLPFSVMAFTIHDGRIVEINALADRDRLQKLELGMRRPSGVAARRTDPRSARDDPGGRPR